MVDLLVQGGKVLDPGQSLNGRLDIAVTKGKVVQIAAHIDPREATRVVDVGGKLVVPGLIDLHAHVYAGVRTIGVNENCLDPDLAGVRSGVTIRAGEVITPDWGPHPWGWRPAPGVRRSGQR